MLTYEKLSGAFWDSMRKSAVSSELLDMTNDPSRHVCALPRDTAAAFTAALAKENLFRRYATTIKAPANSDRIITTDTPVDAEWVAENGAIPEADLNATYLGLEMHKLACISMLDSYFAYDTGFDIEGYLTGNFARIFGKAEEYAFINGNGSDAPRGILHSTDGADVGVTAASATVIAFDEVSKLFFSLKPEYRMNAIWTMNDETALALRELKDSAGNYLWRGTADTLLGRPVVISNHMPSAASGSKPIDACAVVGVCHDIHGHVPKAFLVLKHGYKAKGQLVVAQITQLCKSILPQHSLPHSYEICDSIPLTSVGKVDYRALEQLAAQEAAT